MMRTRNVVIFERLWLGSLGIGVILSVFGPQQSNQFLSDSMMILLQVVAVASNAWLVLLVSRKNSRSSLYLLLIAFLAGVAFDIHGFINMSRPGGQLILTVIQYGMQAYGLYCLVEKNNLNAHTPGQFNGRSGAVGGEGSEGGSSLMLDCALKLLESSKYTEAIELFNDVIRSNPGNIDAYCGRGLCLMRLGEKEKGLSDVRYAALNGSLPAQELLRQQ